MVQIRYFLALCEEMSFTRAAKRIGVSQPSLTTAVRRLEEEFGGRLFERGRLFSRLTELGALVQPDLAEIERSVAAAKRKAEQFAVGCSGINKRIAAKQLLRNHTRASSRRLPVL